MRVSAPLFLFLIPFVASAADIRVANYGVDAAACGSAASPCRSITQAIDIAQAGDTVLVGPGRYGDINGDGDFTDPGDEHGDSAVITLARSGLRIISERGASVTLIDATGSPFTQVAVLIIARGTQFGAAGQGFRVLASDQIYYQGNRTRLNAPNNFWGAPTGPGPDPADAVCNLPNSTTVVAPVAVRPFAHVPLAAAP